MWKLFGVQVPFVPGMCMVEAATFIVYPLPSLTGRICPLSFLVMYFFITSS